jgi:hypothetical protein
MESAERRLIPLIKGLKNSDGEFPVQLPDALKVVADQIHPRWIYATSEDRRTFGVYLGVYSIDGYILAWDSNSKEWKVDG